MSAQVITDPRVERMARADLPDDAIALARWLLGKVLVSQVPGDLRAGRIVETEAYLPGDAACHAYRGITARNRSLFLEGGYAYVYLCYGTSFMLNVSSGPAGIGTGVLLRALQPIAGVERMRRGRGHVRPADIARGPGRLTAAMQVNLSHDGVDLVGGPRLWIGSDGHAVDDIGISVRIGLTKAVEERLRFFVAGSPHLSGSRMLNTWPARTPAG